MNYDLLNAARLALGRALIATSRRLSRFGARLLRHPSGAPEPRRLRSVPAPDPLAPLVTLPVKPWHYRPEDTA